MTGNLRADWREQTVTNALGRDKKRQTFPLDIPDRLIRDDGVGGSNPLTPTKQINHLGFKQSRRRAASGQIELVSILITAAAYEAIRATFPDARRAPPAAGDGEMIRIWLERPIVAKLNQMRLPHEGLSEVIIRTARALG